MIKFSATLSFQHDSIFSPFGADEFDLALEWAQSCGLDGVELVISDYSGLPPAALLRLKAKLDGRALAVSTISTGGAYFREGLSLTSGDAKIRRAARERVCEHIDAAKILASKVTIGLLRGTGSTANLDEEEEWLREQLIEIGAYATTQGVVVLLEAINRYEVKLLNSLAGTANFIGTLPGVSSIKVLWDLFHANIEDLAFGDEIERHCEAIGHVHLADNDRSFPGFGKFDFAAIFGALAAKRFDGFASFECLNRPDAQTVKTEMKAFVQAARASCLQEK